MKEQRKNLYQGVQTDFIGWGTGAGTGAGLDSDVNPMFFFKKRKIFQPIFLKLTAQIFQHILT